MDNDMKRRINISVLINFFSGSVIGLILFYSQFKAGSDNVECFFKGSKAISFYDIYESFRINFLWFLMVYVSKSFVCANMVHPVCFIRGCVNSFALSRLLHSEGFVFSLICILPQCLLFLPVMTYISLKATEHQKGGEFIERKSFLIILLLSFLTSFLELSLNGLFCSLLF